MTNNGFSEHNAVSTKMPKRWLGLLLIGLIVLIGTAVTVKIFNDKAANEKAALEQKYVDDLNAVTAQMLATGVTAEKMISAYTSIWSQNIQDRTTGYDLSVVLEVPQEDLKKYFQPIYEEGKFAKYAERGDFQTAVNLVNTYYTMTNQIAALEAQKIEVAQKMKILNNPPEKYKDSYQLALDMYLTWDEIIALACSPSGSYDSYSQQSEQLLSSFVSRYKEYNIKMAP